MKPHVWPLLLPLFYALLHPGVMAADCNTVCTEDYTPVCGTDAKTYSNLCNLNVEKCQSNSSLEKLSDGQCECRQNVVCTQKYQPHCGTDGNTYSNSCYFAVAKLCSPGLELDKLGVCGSTAGTVQPLVAILAAAILTVLTITH